MTVIQNDLDQEWTREGQLVSQTPVARDITGRAVANDIRTKGLAAITANQTYLALASPSTAQNTAQIRRLTRECTALIRLLLGGGLKHLQDDPTLLDDTATDT